MIIPVHMLSVKQRKSVYEHGDPYEREWHTVRWLRFTPRWGKYLVLYARLPLGNSTTAEELWFSSVQCRGDIYPGGALKNYTHAYIEMDKVYGQ